MSGSPARRTHGPDARGQFVERAVEHILAHGFRDPSLRAMAADLGTSHRMLIYHFGSARGFWDAVLQALQRRDQQAMALATGGGKLPALEETWQQITTGPGLSIFRVLFQLYGEALADPDAHAEFLDDFVARWLSAIESALRERAGKSRAEARVQARLNLAIIRGLMLDLLATGDLKGTTAALRAYARATRSKGRRT